ncbi:MAG: Ig-like domain repeat protein [Candidatus Acidiferrum sp.]
MKTNSQIIRNLLFSFLSLATTAAFSAAPASAQSTSQSAAAVSQASPVPSRITQAIDETKLVTLKGNVHPLARPEFDQGSVSDAMPANRMLLLLQRSADQETSLRQLLEDQQNKGSANFHKWLTPEQYGAQYGPADADIQTVTEWLTSHGFQGIRVGAGRTTIEFSGNVGQVRNAFHTDIHKFVINGEERHASVSVPQIPAALAPVIAGVAGLHNFPPKAQVRRMGTFRRNKSTGEVMPLFTYNPGSGNLFAVGPADFATIYNVAPLWAAGTDGTGQTIAVVGDSNINPQDVTDFRTMFGLPTNNSFNTPKVIVNGPDPGLNGDETEADLDVQWAGAVAENAQIVLVVTEQPITIGAAGVDLSALYIIDNNLAPVMSESFGICEAQANNTLENTLWEQAAAQGISAMVSAGDNGSAGCDPTSTNPLVASSGLAVSGVASTPFNVAVGGTDFNSSLSGYASTYWNTTNAATTQASAKSYVPEITWNNTCAYQGSTTACTSSVIDNDANSFGAGVDVVAGSGGSSAVYTGSLKPSWQAGLGDANRDIPDVSLFAANGRNGSFYVICEQDANAAQGGSASSCDLNSPYLDFIGVGGTSASSPAFAAIMALVNQKTGQRQGNVNYVLYPTSKKTGATCTSNAATAASPGSCVFYDLPAGAGNISVACQGGSPQCSNTSATSFGIMTTTTGGSTPAYNTAAGYDLATGLGSVNAANLVNTWTNPSFTPSNTTFSLNGGTPVSTAHGTAISVSGNVTGSGGTPTGIVELIRGATFPGPVIDTFTLSGGSYSGATKMLPGTNGTAYQVVAHYGGDGTFAASTSSAQTVTSVSKEASTVTVSFVNLLTNTISTGMQSIVYGSPYILRVDVTNASSQQCSVTTTVPCPTGTITLLDGGKPLNDFLVPNTSTPTNSASLTNQGFLEDQPIQLSGGSHSITAMYSGDASYNAQPTSNTLSVAVATAQTQVISFTASPSSGVTTATPVTLSLLLDAPTSNGAGPSGTVTFTANGTTISGTPTITSAGFDANTGAPPTLTATLTTTFSTAGSKNIVATYSGDINYSNASASGTLTVTQATVGTFTMAAGPATVATTAAASGTSSGMSAITITPSGGFNTAVTVTCGTIPGVNCTALTIPPGSTTGSLMINVNNPSSSMTAMVAPDTQNEWAANKPERGGRAGWWSLSAGTGFAAVLLLFLPNKKRYRAALGLGLACVLSFSLACGGGSSGGGGEGGGGGGLTTTVTQLTVSSTKVADSPSATLTVSAAVTGGTPTGTVQFMVDGAALGGPATLTSGSTGNITVMAAQAPAFLQLVGTHTVSANYSGGTTTAASHSGTLNVTITGTTSLPVTGTAGTDTANANVSLTIN